jgi:FkbM family methyltransferase
VKKILRAGLRILLHLYPLYSGTGRFVNSAVVKWLTHAPEVITTRLRSGEWIVVDVHDLCGRYIYFWGDYDPRVTRLAVETLMPGDVFLDIGANYGEVALAAATKVGPSGEVHVFEPNAIAADFMRRSAALNKFSQLKVHEVALGSEDGRSELRGPVGVSGAASIRLEEEPGTNPSEVSYGVVDVRDAESFLRAAVRGRIAAIKIDVEGMEGPILARMEEILRSDQPRRICFESLDDSTPFFERPVVRQLKRIGYRIEQMRVGFSLQIQPVLLPIPESGKTAPGYDFVASLNCYQGAT